MLLFDKCKPRPDAVLFIRDSDNHLTRKTGLDQARNHVPTEYPVVIGFAHTKRECWVIAGFHPANENEESRIAELRGDYPPGIGFDPRHRSDELTAKNPAKLCAKRVLLHLTSGNHDRERVCHITIVKDKLHESRGQNNGLYDFITEIETKLIPLFTGRPHS